MSRIFEPIKKDIKPGEYHSGRGNSSIFSQYANMDPPEDYNWKFGHKTPQPDNLLLAGIHNFLHKNSLRSMGKLKKKGISDPDFEKAFEGHDDSVRELFSDLSEVEFEKPDLRKARREIGRDNELFGMITNLAD